MLIVTDGLSQDVLEPLREVITLEGNKRSDFAFDELAEWLIEEHRDCVIKALGANIADATDRQNDKVRLPSWAFRHEDSELTEVTNGIREIAETLGLPSWYLFELDWSRIKPLLDAVNLVHEIRAEASQAEIDAMKACMEKLEPVWVDHPNMKTGEAMQLLDDRTEETLRKLDEDT